MSLIADHGMNRSGDLKPRRIGQMERWKPLLASVIARQLRYLTGKVREPIDPEAGENLRPAGGEVAPKRSANFTQPLRLASNVVTSSHMPTNSSGRTTGRR
jgi:hypothetical protein